MNCSNISSGILNETCIDCANPSICIIPSDGNVLLAFGLTIGAGMATSVGALLPFIPFIKRANTHFLTIGLSLAAGVMLYVSFTEIWTKSRDNFCCIDPQHQDLSVTLCFFGGVIITLLLDILVGILLKLDCGCSCCCFGKDGNTAESNRKSRSEKNRRFFFRKSDNGRSVQATNALQLNANKMTSDVPILSSALSLGNGVNTGYTSCSNGVNYDKNSISSPVSHGPINCDQQSQFASESGSQLFVGVAIDGASVSINSNAPSDNTNNYNMASINELFSNTSLLRMNAIIPETASLSLAEVGEKSEEEKSLSQMRVVIDNGEEGEDSDMDQDNSAKDGENENVSSDEEALGPVEFKTMAEVLDKSVKKLHRMGILTALAIGLHNFPEGMVTFVAALSSPSLGGALAVAIALHNIPEGMCVSMPVYYATGSRWKGFLWAFLSGVSEPIGALLGWLILKDLFGPWVFGIAFGLISGMMVSISLKELLPTAYKFDRTHGRLVTAFLLVGMLIMAVSLILFLY